MRRPRPERKPTIADAPVFDDGLTDYDYRLLIVYLRLLDAEADGAHWTEATRIVLGIDPDLEPERARHAHQTHLARAHWMASQGYRNLLLEARSH
jgi:hypothetical protein